MLTPDRGYRDLVRVPAADIARDVGLSTNELPGRRFTAVSDGDGFRG
ncbi:hypothetical protein ACFYTC_32630 [Actinomadura nitritigenes]